MWPLLRWVGFLHRRSLLRRTRVVTVIGSVGKTTAARFIWRTLGEPGPAPVGWNSGSTLVRELLRIPLLSPWGVLEVGIRGFGRMARYADMIRPDIVVVTAIASDHNRTLGSLEQTREEKAWMVRGLAPSGVAVLNGDDPHVRRMADATEARIVTYGFLHGNDVRCRSFEPDGPDGSMIEVEADGERCTSRIQLVGRHSAYAALAAAAVGREAGMRLETVLRTIARMPSTLSRMEPVLLPSGAWLIRDEHKAPLESVEAAIETLARVPAERRVVVLGEVEEPPGPKRQVYRRLGERLAGVGDRVILLCSRSGFFAYRSGGRAVQPDFDPVHVRDWRACLDHLDLGPGDVVLIEGRETQGLARLSLALLGRRVTCDIRLCQNHVFQCDHCPALDN